MNPCPIGSFQPGRGGKTCELIGVGGVTNGFEYTPITKSALNTEPNTLQKLVRTLESPVSCGAGVTRKSTAVISGLNLNPSDAKVSVKVDVERENGANTEVSISKVAQSRINGAAFGVVGTCVASNSLMIMKKSRARNIKKGVIEKRTVVTNFKCADSTPKVFAGINEIEAVGLGNGFSLSIGSSVRSNANGFVRPRVEFSSTSDSGILAAGAAVVAYCFTDDALFGQGLFEVVFDARALARKPEQMKTKIKQGYIANGIIDGSGFDTSPSKDSGGNSYLAKNVAFKNEMKCSEPQVTLALTQLETSGGMAVNLQLMSQTSKSFGMRFVAMGSTKIRSIKAAYLATCPQDETKVAKAVQATCGSLPTPSLWWIFVAFFCFG